MRFDHCFLSAMRKSLLVLFVCVALAAVTATAQEGKGTISGKATDGTGGVLQGALVQLQSQAASAVTDAQGQFTINVAPGHYAVNVSYVGFTPFSSEVDVTAGQTVHVDAALKVGSVEDQIIVRAERLQGEAEAINIERTSDNIVQVLPSKVITSLPNTNVADAIGRLPSVTLERDEGEGKYVQIRGTEPRLSNVTINGVSVPSPEGNVRNIKLDVIPSGIVDRIEVNKTLSANQDADAIGGSVNLVTKTPGDRATFDFMTSGGYTPIQDGRWLNGFDGTLGKRFGEKKKLGLLFGGTYDHNDRGIDDLEPSTAIGNPVSNPNQNVAIISGEDFRTYKYYRTRYGFDGDVDYNITDNTSVYLKGLYSDFHDFGSTWVFTPNTGNIMKAVNGSQVTFFNAADCIPLNLANPGSCNPGFMQAREYTRRPDQQIFSVLTGARHDLKTMLITYEFAGSRSHSIGGFPTTNFNNVSPALNNVDFGLDLSDPYRPRATVPNGVNIFDPAQYAISESEITHERSTQVNFQGGATLQKRYTLGSHYGAFEFGTQVRNADKTQNFADQFFEANPGTNFAMSQMLSTQSNPTYYDKYFGGYGPLTNYATIWKTVQSNLQTGFTSNTDKDHQRSDPATYEAIERVYSGYAMNTINFGKLRVQAGVRIEATDTSYTANQVNLSNGAYQSTVPVTGSSGYINVLPTVQVQYPLGQNSNIRAVFGMGISRPNFSDIVPSVQVDPNASPKSVILGNPALKPTTAKDYDLLFEHYFKPLGVLQAGFFYKDLTDPIYPTTITLTSGPLAGYQQQQSINGPNGHITGFETAWEQRLSFLPGALNGFGVSANYSYTTSQVTFPAGFAGGRTDHPALQRQAPNAWNLGMTYDKARFAMRFSVSHNDANIFFYNYQQTPNPNDPITGVKGPLGDNYLYAHTQYDVQGSYRLVKGLKVIVSGLNLSNEVFGFYQGSPLYPVQREYYHPSVLFALKWSSGAE